MCKPLWPRVAFAAPRDAMVEIQSVLRGAGDVAGNAAALATTKCHMRARRRRDVGWSTIDRSGTRWTGKRRSASVVCDQMKCLRWVIRNRAWLAHMPLLNNETTPDNDGAGPPNTANLLIL